MIAIGLIVGSLVIGAGGLCLAMAGCVAAGECAGDRFEQGKAGATTAFGCILLGAAFILMFIAGLAA